MARTFWSCVVCLWDFWISGMSIKWPWQPSIKLKQKSRVVQNGFISVHGCKFKCWKFRLAGSCFHALSLIHGSQSPSSVLGVEGLPWKENHPTAVTREACSVYSENKNLREKFITHVAYWTLLVNTSKLTGDCNIQTFLTQFCQSTPARKEDTVCFLRCAKSTEIWVFQWSKNKISSGTCCLLPY